MMNKCGESVPKTGDNGSLTSGKLPLDSETVIDYNWATDIKR